MLFHLLHQKILINCVLYARYVSPSRKTCLAMPKIKLFCCSVTKSHLTLCDPMDCSPPGSSLHVISQVRILEWAAISFSKFVYQVDLLFLYRSSKFQETKLVLAWTKLGAFPPPEFSSSVPCDCTLGFCPPHTTPVTWLRGGWVPLATLTRPQASER